MVKRNNVIIRCISAVICMVVILFGAIYACCAETKTDSNSSALQVITIWQIDSFEGGKGSRAGYLKKIGETFCKNKNIYIEVSALSADAVRSNLASGIYPDIISYGSGIYGLENYVNENSYSKIWLNGAYCFLSINTDDFSMINAQNTIINAGRDNLTCVTASLYGINGAAQAQPASAYVKLINGDYTYLLGTQRDIVRLQTRNIKFYVYPAQKFNDLYQYITIFTSDNNKVDLCKEYINYLTENSENVSDLCMYYNNETTYDNELSFLQTLQPDYTVTRFISKTWLDSVKEYANSGDNDKLKSMLKSL